MSTEIIEGTAVELVPEVRAVAVVQQPGQALVAADTETGPEDMLARATKIATALARMVEAQQLYTTIQRKKYPHVEAWMTIGRMDNVVAREARPPVKNDDGSWEAFVDLVRLSDGMVIGSSSAMCGAPKDGEWTNRGDHMKRSMAQTRATSRVFRQQYSWIMALAGYQPTPAEEMPEGGDHPPAGAEDAAPEAAVVEGRVVSAGNGLDLSLRYTPEGVAAFGFKLLEVVGHPRGKKTSGVRMFGPGASALSEHAKALNGARVKVIGRLHPESFEDKETQRTVNYHVIHADSVAGETFAVMNTDPDPSPPVSESAKVSDLDNLPW